MTTGTCTACALPFSLRVDGTVRTHGPYKNRCPGSNQAPVPEQSFAEWVAEPEPGSLPPVDQIVDAFEPVLAEVGDSITSILDEAYPDTVPTGNGDVPEVVRWMVQEHNDLLRMADYRTLAAWAAGKRDEIQAMREERGVRNARYDEAFARRYADAQDRLWAVTA